MYSISLAFLKVSCCLHVHFQEHSDLKVYTMEITLLVSEVGTFYNMSVTQEGI